MVVPLNNTELALTSSMCAVIPVKPVTTPASKLTINPILVMACGFACSSSAFIVPLHDSVRTAAVAGSEAQINAKATNIIRNMAYARQQQLHQVMEYLLGFPKSQIAYGRALPTADDSR